MTTPRLPGETVVQRSVSALAVYAAFFLLLLAGFSVSNSMISSGSADVTPAPSSAAP